LGLIETVNQMVRASRQMRREIGREPTPDELAARLAMPLAEVREVLGIATMPRRSR
jgi:RNA polymerase primary sigma factor